MLRNFQLQIVGRGRASEGNGTGSYVFSSIAGAYNFKIAECFSILTKLPTQIRDA